MGDDERRAGCVAAPLADAAHGALDLVLCRAVDGTRAVVQDKDARIRQEGPGDGDALPLPAGERHAALSDLSLIPLRESGDEPVGLGGFGCLLDGGLVGVGKAKGNVLGEGV